MKEYTPNSIQQYETNQEHQKKSEKSTGDSVSPERRNAGAMPAYSNHLLTDSSGTSRSQPIHPHVDFASSGFIKTDTLVPQ